jgi:hypothetical protein
MNKVYPTVLTIIHKRFLNTVFKKKIYRLKLTILIK